jgi:hypothetical protein
MEYPVVRKDDDGHSAKSPICKKEEERRNYK